MNHRALFALIAAGVIGAAGAGVAAASGTSTNRRGEVIHLTATTASHIDIDLGAPGFGVGDQAVDTDDLSHNGRLVGHGGGICQFTSVTDTTYTAYCVNTLDLPDGQLVTEGLVTAPVDAQPTPFDLAITGGTGRYANARGSGTFIPGEHFEMTLRLSK